MLQIAPKGDLVAAATYTFEVLAFVYCIFVTRCASWSRVVDASLRESDD